MHFYGLKHMPIADLNMVSAASPAITVVFAWIVLRERCNLLDAINLLLVFTGIVFIIKPPILFGENVAELVGTSENYFLAATIVAFGTILQANVYVLLKMLKGKLQ